MTKPAERPATAAPEANGLFAKSTGAGGRPAARGSPLCWWRSPSGSTSGCSVTSDSSSRTRTTARPTCRWCSGRPRCCRTAAAVHHWYANLSLGSPYFVQYQSASAVLTGCSASVSARATAFAWTLYLLLALWPLCVYWTRRLLGLGQMGGGDRRGHRAVAVRLPGAGSRTRRTHGLAAGCGPSSGRCGPSRSRSGSAGGTSRGGSTCSVRSPSSAPRSRSTSSCCVPAGRGARAHGVPQAARRGRGLRRGAVMGIGTLLASAWVWLPWLSSREWSAPQQFQVNTHINDSWGPDGSSTGWCRGRSSTGGSGPGGSPSSRSSSPSESSRAS